jgi:hypothetical protein
MSNSAQGGEEAPFKVEAGYQADLESIQLDADGMISPDDWNRVVDHFVRAGNDTAVKLRDALLGWLENKKIPYKVLFVYTEQGDYGGYAATINVPFAKGWRKAKIHREGWYYMALVCI